VPPFSPLRLVAPGCRTLWWRPTVQLLLPFPHGCYFLGSPWHGTLHCLPCRLCLTLFAFASALHACLLRPCWGYFCFAPQLMCSASSFCALPSAFPCLFFAPLGRLPALPNFIGYFCILLWLGSLSFTLARSLLFFGPCLCLDISGFFIP